MMKEVMVGLIGNSCSSFLIFMADKIDGLRLGFENLIIGLVIPGIGLGAVSVEAGTWPSHIGLDRYFESYHHCFPPCCHAPSLIASPPVALPFKAPHGR